MTSGASGPIGARYALGGERAEALKALEEARLSLRPTARTRLFGVTRKMLDRAYEEERQQLITLYDRLIADAPETDASASGEVAANRGSAMTALAGDIAQAAHLINKKPGLNLTPSDLDAYLSNLAFSNDVRQWARDHGIEVKDQGRMSKNVVERYRDAHD